MPNKLWTEVEDAYSRAARLPPEERKSFLDKTYSDRPDIRLEVESLLQYEEAAKNLTPSTMLEAVVDMFSDQSNELIGTVVAGKYLIRECLGATRMSEVYLADHITLGVPFALKRAAPILGSDLEFRRRLIDEARRAVILKHENVTRVHDVIESGTDVFLVMEYIEGDTLRERLRTTQPISGYQFFEIAIQCASALAAAHKKRIVHLDVKPENIMLTPAGQVKICDFGVARRLSMAGPGDTTEAAEAWKFAGTPAYMAPEVILSYQFDERADLFSLGTVLYEMLTGRNPFVATTAVATTARVVRDIPAPIHELNPNVDIRLERIVTRLLAKEPEARYGTASELVAELEAVHRSRDRIRNILQNITEAFRQTRALTVLAAVLVLSVLVLPAVWIYRDGLFRGKAALPSNKIVAVLPFRVIGEGRGERLYSEGVSEILTSKLTQLTTIPNLQVIPPSEIRDRNVDTIDKARAEFGATLVLAGTFQFSGDQVRLSYALIDPASRRELRAASKQFPVADTFTTQDAVIRDVVTLLELELTPPARQALAIFGTNSPEAYFLYTEARGALRNFHETENIETAIRLFTQASQLDPTYAAAHAGLGQGYWQKFLVSKERGWLDQARGACEKAVSLDQQLSQAYSCLGTVNQGNGEYERAAEYFNRAISLEPTNDDAQRELGRTLEAWGHFDDGERAYLQAIDIRPQYWAGYTRLAAFYKNRRHDYDKAIENYYKALAASPGNGQIFYSLGGTYIDAGDYDKAISMLQKAAQLRPYWETHYNLGMAYLRARRFGDAQISLEKAASLTKDYRATGSLARIYGLTGQSAKAADTYQRAISEGQKLLEVNPRDSDVHVLVGRYYAMLGMKPEALSHLTLALNTASNDPHYLVIAAVAYLQLGDRNTALNLMEQAMAHGAAVKDIRAEPELDALAGDPRYIALVSNRHQN